MMINRRLGWAAAATALIGAVACEQAKDPAVPKMDLPVAFTLNAPQLPVDATDTISVRDIYVCKTGPAGTYNYSITDISTTAGTINFPAGNTFSVDAGSCLLVAHANDNGRRVSITETGGGPGNTVLDSVVNYLFLSGSGVTTGPTSFFSKTFSATDTVPAFGGDRGWIVNYINSSTPVTGCTLTLGYWKTHNASFGGGAPVDPTWNLITPSAEQTTFFLSGDTWFGVFWTAPAGNAYYQLAHQYMAAVLNKLAGAGSTPAVDAAIADATTLFNTYTPAQIGALAKNSALRAQFLADATTLGDYNEGIIGPGHCQ